MRLRDIIIILVAIITGTACVSCGREKEDDTAIRIATEVKSVDRLVLAQMSVSKIATISDLDLTKANGLRESAQALIDALKIGDRKAAFSYNTYMRAYVDLTSFSAEDVKVDNSDSTVNITLPPIQTEFSGRDAQMRVEHYRVTGFRSQVGAEERAEIKERINASLKKEVESDKTFQSILTESAELQGRRYFENLCSRFGYKANVTFR